MMPIYKQLCGAMKKNQSKNKPKKQVDQAALNRFEVDNNQKKSPAPKRRLKKMSQVNQDQEMLSKSELGQDEGIQEQQEYNQFEVKDDEQLQKQKKMEEAAKQSKKLKGNQQIDKFMTKPAPAAKNKKPQAQPRLQLTINEMMNRQKQKKKQRKDSDDFLGNVQLSSKQEQQIQARRLAAYQQYNGSKEDQQELIRKAMKLSLASNQANLRQNHEKMENQPIGKYTESIDDFAYRPDLDNNNQGKESKPLHKTQSKDISKQLKQQKPDNKSKKQPQQSKLDKSKGRKKSAVKQSKNGPLSDYVIAFTGEFDSYQKDQLMQICGQLGANIAKSITQKCNLLMQGSYVVDNFKRKTNRPVNQTSKSVQAQKKGIQILAFDQIQNFIYEKTGQSLSDHMNKNKVKVNPIASMIDKLMDQQDDIILTKPSQKIQKQQKIQVIPSKDAWSQLWTDKYKPKNIEQIIGQTSQLKQLKQWLSSWQDIQIRGNKRQVRQARGGFNSSGNINSKAALLSGDPGIGKTSSARLIAAQCFYGVNQFNASDVRNKKGVGLLQSGSLQIGAARNLQKSVIIMDQVDGMSSGDRGGITAIIQMIKTSKVPIICICNDRANQKIRSLANHCLDIKFHKPLKGALVQRLKQILRAQGGSGQDRALEQLVQVFQNDMRQILTYLQVIFNTVSRKITIDALRSRNSHTKDSAVMINPFQASRKLLNRSQFSGMTIAQRNQCFFVDSDMVPLLVHQNILASAKKTKMDQKQFHNLVQGIKGMRIGDQIDTVIRKTQDYGLMPSYGFMSCVYSTQKISAALGFPTFPAWLGKFSSQRKSKRISRQLKNAMLPATYCPSWQTIRFQHAPLLTHILSTLITQNQIQPALQLMQQYRLTPSMLQQHLPNLYINNQSSNPLSSIPSQMKGKLTRMFNKKHEDAKMKVKGGKVKEEHHGKYDPVLEEEVEDMDGEEEEEEMEKEEEVKVVGKNKGKKK